MFWQRFGCEKTDWSMSTCIDSSSFCADLILGWLIGRKADTTYIWGITRISMPYWKALSSSLVISDTHIKHTTWHTILNQSPWEHQTHCVLWTLLWQAGTSAVLCCCRHVKQAFDVSVLLYVISFILRFLLLSLLYAGLKFAQQDYVLCWRFGLDVKTVYIAAA